MFAALAPRATALASFAVFPAFTPFAVMAGAMGPGFRGLRGRGSGDRAAGQKSYAEVGPSLGSVRHTALH